MPDPIQTLQPLPQTPANYITPDALEEMRKYSQAMLTGSGQQPVHHWTQGVSNMVNALIGGDMGWRANQREIASQQYRLSQNPAAAGTMGNPTPDGSPKPVSQGDQPSAQPASFASRLNASLPVQKVADTGGGGTRGSVFGNYQGKYTWTDKSDRGNQASGVPVQAGPGIALPTRHTLGQLFDVTTPDGRTFTVKQTDWGPAAWTGRGVDINAALAEQMGYNPKNFPTDARFTVKPHQGGAQQATAQKINWQPNQPQPPQAPGDPGGAGYSGTAYGAAQAAAGTPAAAPMQMAGGPRPGVAGGAGMGQPAPVGAAPAPGLVGMRPQVSKDQYIQSQLPGAEPWRQQMVTDMYYQQHLPLTFPGTGGNWVINPNNPNERAWVPDMQTRTLESEGSKYPQPYTVQQGPSGPYVQPLPLAPGARGGQSGAPAQPSPDQPLSLKPDPTRPGATPPTAAPSPSSTPAAPSSGPSIPATPISATSGAPSATPQDGYNKVGAGRGTLYIPKDAPPVTKTAQPGAQIPAPPAESGAGAPDLGSMSAEQYFGWAQKQHLGTKAGEVAATKDAEKYSDELESTQHMSVASENLGNQIQLAKQLVNDSRVIQGPGANIRTDWNKFLSFFGDENATSRVGISQAFDKLKSSNILADMSAKLKGLGQIRLAEIFLLAQSNIGRENTPAANMAILNLAERGYWQLQKLGEIQRQYDQGTRWGPDGNPLPGRSSDIPSFTGLMGAERQFLKNNPVSTEEEMDNVKKLFDTGKETPAENTNPYKAEQERRKKSQ